MNLSTGEEAGNPGDRTGKTYPQLSIVDGDKKIISNHEFTTKIRSTDISSTLIGASDDMQVTSEGYPSQVTSSRKRIKNPMRWCKWDLENRFNLKIEEERFVRLKTVDAKGWKSYLRCCPGDGSNSHNNTSGGRTDRKTDGKDNRDGSNLLPNSSGVQGPSGGGGFDGSGDGEKENNGRKRPYDSADTWDTKIKKGKKNKADRIKDGNHSASQPSSAEDLRIVGVDERGRKRECAMEEIEGGSSKVLKKRIENQDMDGNRPVLDVGVAAGGREALRQEVTGEPESSKHLELSEQNVENASCENTKKNEIPEDATPEGLLSTIEHEKEMESHARRDFSDADRPHHHDEQLHRQMETVHTRRVCLRCFGISNKRTEELCTRHGTFICQNCVAVDGACWQCTGEDISSLMQRMRLHDGFQE